MYSSVVRLIVLSKTLKFEGKKEHLKHIEVWQYIGPEERLTLKVFLLQNPGPLRSSLLAPCSAHVGQLGQITQRTETNTTNHSISRRMSG